MSLRTTMTAILVAGAATAAVTTLNVAPAGAASGYDRCPSNRVCVFTGLNGTGAIGIFAIGDGNLGDASGPRGLNNNIKSVWNRRAETWLTFDKAGFSGEFARLDPRVKSNVIPSFRNRISSLGNVRDL